MNIAKVVTLTLITSMILFSSESLAQTLTDLRWNKGEWIVGEGYGNSEKEADNKALESLSSQIQVKVSSEMNLKSSTSQTRRGKRIQDVETDSLETIISTWSQATLNNCRKMVVENGPDKYHIIRYISVADIQKAFKYREDKIRYMLNVAEKAESELKMDAALKNYYWAYILINTLPSPSSLHYTDINETSQMASVWTAEKIRSILDGITFEFDGFVNEDKTLGKLHATYHGQSITSVDYTYSDGISWSVLMGAKDGLGMIELRKDTEVPSISLSIEYSYDNELHQDPEIDGIVSLMKPINFREAYKSKIPLKEKSRQKGRPFTSSRKETEEVYSFAVVQEEQKEYFTEVVDRILLYLHSPEEDLRDLFTSEGYDAYTRLIKYGKAKVLTSDNLSFMQFNHEVYCKGVAMDFAFETNDKHFVEDVVFIFNEEGKVNGLTFGLEQKTIEEINSMDRWLDEEKMMLISFLENYKTAFALKNLGYISSIFSEDALIITGRVLQKVNIENQSTLQEQYVKYNRQSKEEYMRNLGISFRSKEYINLKFTNLKASSWREGLFGVSIKQDYYSSNYGDSGYLFLYVDLRDFNRPIIHVRTWQPERDYDINSITGLYGPGNFN